MNLERKIEGLKKEMERFNPDNPATQRHIEAKQNQIKIMQEEINKLKNS